VGHLGIIDDVVIFFICSKSCIAAVDVSHEVATSELLDSRVGFSQPPLRAWDFALGFVLGFALGISHLGPRAWPPGVSVYLVLLVLTLFNAH
jgi:hypothetical protein